jgi:hypothetical protein
MVSATGRPLHELLNAIQGTNYAHAVLQSNKTIDHAEGSGFGPRRLKIYLGTPLGC